MIKKNHLNTSKKKDCQPRNLQYESYGQSLRKDDPMIINYFHTESYIHLLLLDHYSFSKNSLYVVCVQDYFFFAEGKNLEIFF